MSAPPNAIASSSTHHKSHKKHKSKDKDRKDKSKHKDKSEKTGPFEHRTSRLRLSIPPRYGGDYLAGIKDILNGMLMRYVPQMNGVLLAHWEHELLDDTVKIINECPYGVCEVKFYSILWAPKIGQKLYGTHSLSSPSHISLLFSKTFNVSIPLQHIPIETFEFEHTAPEEDAESDSEDELDLNGGGVEEVGRWKRKDDGKLLGEGGKAVKFTVIGMQVTNQMLSLTGSLLADPSNPPPPPDIQSIRAPPSPSLSPEPMEVDEPAPPPTKKPRQQKQSNGHAQARPQQSVPEVQAQAPAEPQIDERFLSARELKKKRKDEEKRKRDERKSRKEAGQIEALEEAGAGMMVGMNGEEGPEVGSKRKAGDVDEEGKKRKKQ